MHTDHGSKVTHELVKQLFERYTSELKGIGGEHAVWAHASCFRKKCMYVYMNNMRVVIDDRLEALDGIEAPIE
jgi:hypothetical protein